ncbi:MAG: tyrosine-type recombinase/integrase [Geminicoccaceae bacterium]
MARFNAKNERLKRAYCRYLREADQKAESTIRSVEKALGRFEAFTNFQDFGRFGSGQAVGFKKDLLGPHRLSKATALSTVNVLKRFFKWLACQPGYKSRIHLPDVDYLNLSEKDARAATAPRYRDFPTIEQVRKVINGMPSGTEVERRDRALVAFTILTGMRDSAMASLRLKHVDLDRQLVKQDPNEVRTKFSKRIDTFFFPVDDDLIMIVSDWVSYLRDVRLFGNNDPLFPRTAIGQDADGGFVAAGIEAECWATTSPIRAIYRRRWAERNEARREAWQQFRKTYEPLERVRRLHEQQKESVRRYRELKAQQPQRNRGRGRSRSCDLER